MKTFIDYFVNVITFSSIDKMIALVFDNVIIKVYNIVIKIVIKRLTDD